MNNNDNADKVGQTESISSSQVDVKRHLTSDSSKNKPKGTGFLRSNSPKNKKVPSLFSPQTQDNDKILENNETKSNTNEQTPNLNNNKEKTSNSDADITKTQSPLKKRKTTTSKVLSTKTNKNTDILMNTEKQIDTTSSSLQEHTNTNEVENIQTDNGATDTPQVKKFEKPNPYRNIIHKKQNRSENNRFDKKNNQQKYKKTFSNQPRELTAQEYEREKEEIALEVIKEHPPVEKVLSLIRQRTGFVASDFWKEFDLVQSSEHPIDLKSESATIINYAVLFNKEEIYSELLEKYHTYLVADDFHGNLISYCANKSSYFLDKTIMWYDKLFNDKEKLANLLLEKLCYCSFRQENNFIWLSWLDKNANDEILNKFWTKTFEFNNVVLMIEGLYFKKIATYLKNNLDTFNSQIEHCSKTYQIHSQLNNPHYYVDRANEHLEIDFVHRAKEFELSLLEQVKDKREIKEERKIDRKEESATEVIIKKKKSYEPNQNNNPSPFL